jgi:hypothetical protein
MSVLSRPAGRMEDPELADELGELMLGYLLP